MNRLTYSFIVPLSELRLIGRRLRSKWIQNMSREKEGHNSQIYQGHNHRQSNNEIAKMRLSSSNQMCFTFSKWLSTMFGPFKAIPMNVGSEARARMSINIHTHTETLTLILSNTNHKCERIFPAPPNKNNYKGLNPKGSRATTLFARPNQHFPKWTEHG